MGCLRFIIKVIILAFAFIGIGTIVGGKIFQFNVQDLTKNNNQIEVNKQNSYKDTKLFDLSKLSEEYILKGDYQILNYNLLLVTHKGSKQKFILLSSNKDKIWSNNDFNTNESQRSIEKFFDQTSKLFVRLENFNITKKGKINIFNQNVNYWKFKADSYHLPFKNIVGFIAPFKYSDDKNSLFISYNQDDTYSQIITEAFLKQLKK